MDESETSMFREKQFEDELRMRIDMTDLTVDSRAVRFSKTRRLKSEPVHVPSSNRALFDWTVEPTNPKVRLEQMKRRAKDRRKDTRKRKLDRGYKKTSELFDRRSRSKSAKRPTGDNEVFDRRNQLPPLSSLYSSNEIEPYKIESPVSDPIDKQLDFIEKQLKQMEDKPLVPTQISDRTSCAVNRGGCDHICIQNGTRVKCLCYKGFRLDANGSRCFDIDECSRDPTACSDGCRNVPGSFHCVCPTGYRLSSYDRRTCLDINECLLRNGHGPCEDTCVNTRGSFECTCNGTGARLADDARSCVRFDRAACSKCSHTCVHVASRGVGFCTCPEGLFLGQDYRTCEDIDECESPEIRSVCPSGCINTFGSFRCVPESQNFIAAKTRRLETPDHIVCPPLFPPQHGYLDCRRDNVTSHGRRTIHGRYRLRNRPGTTCTLVCPHEQYRQDGRAVKVCGSDGRWISNDDGKCIPHPRPRIRCPSKIHKRVPYASRRSARGYVVGKPTKVLVPIPVPALSPPLDFDRDVVTQPIDAKKRVVALEPGVHWIKYTVTHPESKRNASCMTIVRVDGFKRTTGDD